MSLNSALLEGVQSFENTYGDTENWPVEGLKKLTKVANRPGEHHNSHNRRVSNKQMIDLLTRGFSTQYVADVTHRSTSRVSTVRHELKHTPGFEYQATPEDLDQLRYTRARLKGKTRRSYPSVAAAMDRKSDWVAAMVDRL